MSDDKKPSPDNAPIVTSLDEITGDGPVLWTSDAMATQSSGTIFAIPDDGTRGSWREPWPSAEGKPKHALSAPILMCGTCGKSAGAGDACQHCGAILMKWGLA